MKRVRKKANLGSVHEPQLVTLTRSPANKIGFKVMRSAEQVERSDDYLIAIELPEGVDEQTAEQVAVEFGLSEQYSLVKKNSRWLLQRNDAIITDDYVAVSLPEGRIAHVSPEAFQRSEEFIAEQVNADEDDSKDNQAIRLLSVRFDRTIFPSPADVDEWLKNNDIDYPSGGVEQTDAEFCVTRSDTDGDTREIAFAEGVTGVICRAATLDYPNALYGRTAEQAYGDWGWGQLDFTAMAADVEFSERAGEAIFTLQRVLNNIVIGSELPLDTRKQLIVNAVSGYAAYTIGLIDALPRAVIEQARSDEQTNGQEKDMSTEDNEQAAESVSVDTTVERTDAEAETQEEENKELSEETQEFVTRSELTEVVTAAVAAAIGGGSSNEQAATEETTEETQRSDGEDATGEQPSEMQQLIGAVKTMAGVLEGVQAEQKSLRSDFDEAEGATTVTRSTEAEGVVDDGEPQGEVSVFAGMFGRNNG